MPPPSPPPPTPDRGPPAAAAPRAPRAPPIVAPSRRRLLIGGRCPADTPPLPAHWRGAGGTLRGGEGGDWVRRGWGGGDRGDVRGAGCTRASPRATPPPPQPRGGTRPFTTGHAPSPTAATPPPARTGETPRKPAPPPNRTAPPLCPEDTPPPSLKPRPGREAPPRRPRPAPPAAPRGPGGAGDSPMMSPQGYEVSMRSEPPSPGGRMQRPTAPRPRRGAARSPPAPQALGVLPPVAAHTAPRTHERVRSPCTAHPAPTRDTRLLQPPLGTCP